MKSFQELKEKYAFPRERPNVPNVGNGGMYHAENMFSHILKNNFKLILEIGVCYGECTRHITKFCPTADIVVLDNWSCTLGSDHKPRDIFVNRLWDYRNNISIIDGDSKSGLKILSEYDIKPNLIYIDGFHSYDYVFYEVEMCYRLFPEMMICGDDFRIDMWDKDFRMCGVDRAVMDFLNKYGQDNFNFKVYEDNSTGSWCIAPKKRMRPCKGPKIRYS